MTAFSARMGRILIVDNDPDRLVSNRALLDFEGYQVFTANTLQIAADLLTHERAHLALLDIRMEADLDPQDLSGIKFAAEIDPIVSKIILTAYPTFESLLEVFGPEAKTPALDFIDKREGPYPVLAAVERAFQDYIKINFDLNTRWLDGLSRELVAQEIALSNYPLDVVSNEVDEVLCKLFFAADEIVISPMVPGAHSRLSSQSGSTVLKVEANYQEVGWGTPVVVKLAERENIITEVENYDRYVKNFVGDHRRTNLERFAETHLLGGIVYSLVGTSLDETMDLRRLYTQHDAASIIASLNDIFKKSCRLWYASRRSRQETDFVRLYKDTVQMSAAKIKAAMRADNLSEFITPMSYSLPESRQRLINPIRWFEQNPYWVTSFFTCCTHGDLHSENVLLDDSGQVWLIDFYRTGEGHILRDLIELETDIKFNLLKTTDLSLLFEFETVLLTPRYLGDVVSPRYFNGRPELEKAFTVVTALREIARNILGKNAEMKEYYWGLFLLTLNAVRLKGIGRPKKKHALLSAALLAQRLNGWS